MKTVRNFTAIIEREGNGYIALCPELTIARPGATMEESKINLQEAIELFFEHASRDEIASRLKSDILITHMQIEV